MLNLPIVGKYGIILKRMYKRETLIQNCPQPSLINNSLRMTVRYLVRDTIHDPYLFILFRTHEVGGSAKYLKI